MREGSIYVCRVDGPEGCKDYVTVVPPAAAFAKGLPSEAIVGVLLRPLGPEERIGPENFARNQAFVEFLHAVVARYGPDQTGCRDQAQRLGEGWIYIVDQRTATPGARVPPEDIIGAFRVEAGQIVAGSYKSNGNHVLLSSRGFFQLHPGLHECLLRELAVRHGPQRRLTPSA